MSNEAFSRKVPNYNVIMSHSTGFHGRPVLMQWSDIGRDKRSIEHASSQKSPICPLPLHFLAAKLDEPRGEVEFWFTCWYLWLDN